MKSTKWHNALRILFTAFMLTSAFGELTMNPTVVHSMQSLQMPVYLLYLLGALKILGLTALWLPGHPRLKEWAYAGFTFDFVGAIYGFLATGKLLFPDIVMAPAALAICLATYFFYHKARTSHQRMPGELFEKPAPKRTDAVTL